MHHPPARVLRAGRPRNRSLRNAILWDDGRAGAQLAELGERFGHDELHRRTGRGPSLTQAFRKLLWLVQNEPEVAERAHRFMDAHGYLVQRLTGEWTTSLASADSFGLADVARDDRPLFPAVQGPLDRLAEIRAEGDGDDDGSAAAAR